MKNKEHPTLLHCREVLIENRKDIKLFKERKKSALKDGGTPGKY